MLVSTELHASLGEPVLDSLNFLNEVIGRYPHAISFAPGAPNPMHLQDIDIDQYINLYLQYLCHHKGFDLASAYRLIYQYGPAKGLINDLIATSIQQDKGLNISPESLVVTVGAQEAMLIVLRALFRTPQDALAVVSPCFVGILGAAKLLNIDVVEIHETEQGIDLEQLHKKCTLFRQNNQPIRALYVAPDYSNPAGTVLNLETRLQLLKLAKQHQFLIIEDNAYGFTAPLDEHIPPLKVLDKTQQVIFIGTFAKVCLPGARVGYVIADQIVQDSYYKTHLLADDLATIKSMVTVNTSPICQALIGGMILERNGSLGALERERSILYRHNLQFLLSELKRQMPESIARTIQWNRPTGGFFVRVRLPIPTDKALLEYCASEFGVLWTPMSIFYLNSGGTHELRLSCSYLTLEQIKEGVSRMVRFFCYTKTYSQSVYRSKNLSTCPSIPT